MNGAPWGHVEVRLLLTDQLAAEFRKPGGWKHFGQVTMRLTGDPGSEVLGIWFDELDAHIDGDA